MLLDGTTKNIVLHVCQIDILTSKDVLCNVIHIKCLLVLLLAMVACLLLPHNIHYLEFNVNSLMKLFSSSSVGIFNECCDLFGLLGRYYHVTFTLGFVVNSSLMSILNSCVPKCILEIYPRSDATDAVAIA